MPEGRLPPKGENDLADQIREAIGAGPDDEVLVTTPQFERTPDMPIPACRPSTKEEWEALRTMKVDELREMGLGVWNKPDLEGKVLMLFPGEWYPHIPEGLWIEDLNTPVEDARPTRLRPRKEKEFFEPGKTDDDIRFGMLAYGVRVRP